ncbi:fibrinogen-like protein 1 [Musca vetustissima]|uniref:fibrinogen-like protein 1 n=1 Tax=Musca vetustissima TaxID=27455 RepID=UPI002AB6F58D|nr:fibrinogen-like protein 1 [Musca vetustissima]
MTFRDPIPEDNNTELWRILYSKLNRLLDETDTLRQLIQEMRDSQSHQSGEISNILKLTKSAAHKCPAAQVMRKHSKTPSPTATSAPRHEWTVILRRQDGSENFQRDWYDYRNGFGQSPDGEFFIGLERLHQLTTNEGPQELMITLRDWENEERYARYDHFVIGSEAEEYALRELGEYSGTAGDAMAYHKGMKFSTLDHSNSGLCPRNYGGGWWFNQCVDSNLNSVYRQGGESTEMQKILWATWKGFNYSMKFVEMKIRPRK